jgi:hypothetical protein
LLEHDDQMLAPPVTGTDACPPVGSAATSRPVSRSPGGGPDVVVEDDPPTVAARPERLWRLALTATPVVALAVPFAIMIGLSLSRPWHPSSDLALMELRTHDVGGPMNPLVGAYSRFGWNHPGPLGYWVLAVPYRLFGARPAGMLAGTVLVHVAAVAGCLALAHRRGGRALLVLVALLLAVLLRGFGMANLVSFWNPYLPVFALAFLILATWSVTEGDWWLLPVVIAVSCFAWQTHIGYLPVAAGLALVAAAATARAWFGGVEPDRRRSLVLATAVAVTVAGVCLAPLVLDQLAGEPGNLGLLLRRTRGGYDAEPIGLNVVLAVTGAHLGPVGNWLNGQGGGVFSAPGGAPLVSGAPGAVSLIVTFLTAGSVLVAAVRSRAASAARLLGLTILGAVLAIAAVSQTLGAPHPYLYVWMFPVSGFLWVAVVWALIEIVRRRPVPTSTAWRRSAMFVAVLASVATVGLCVAVVGSARPWRLPNEDMAATLAAIGPATTAATAGTPRVRVRAGHGWCALEMGRGLAVQLAESGTDIAVDDQYPLEFGRGRARADALPVVDLYCGPDTGERVRQSADHPVVTFGLLSEDELAEYRALADGFRAQLRADGRTDLITRVETQALGTMTELAWEGYPLDPVRVARYDLLTQKGRLSGAVFWRPNP